MTGLGINFYQKIKASFFIILKYLRIRYIHFYKEQRNKLIINKVVQFVNLF